MKLISLDAVVAKIDDWRDKIMKGICIIPLKGHQRADATLEYEILEKVRELLDTFEVKEVDLGFQRFAKEMDAIFALPSSETENTEEEPLNWEYAIAKHFFELGLRSTITEEDCKLIWNIGDEIPNMPEEEFFKELLRRYKERKEK